MRAFLLLAFIALALCEEAAVAQDTTFTEPDLSTSQVDGHKFQAEINQLMSLIVNSLYSNRDIFVRELISNSADALDKIRYLSLADPSLLGEQKQLDIRIKVDKENKKIHIRDTGIGMTKDELVNNLGSIAKSGTKDFVKKVQAGAEDLTQIGQFGVGFYSSFLVADKVTVTSKHNDDEQHIWESSMDESAAFNVAKDPRGNTLGRGTLITLHIKEDAVEYLEIAKLKEVVQHYTQFLTFPIYIWESHEEDAPEEPKEETPEEPKEETAEDVEVAEELDEEEEEATPEPPKKITVWNWEQANSVQPLWTRRVGEIEEQEYLDFYSTLDKYGGSPLNWTHFKAEGEVEFTALLYIPTQPPPGSTDFVNAVSSVKLYVKRVFISDNFEAFLPSYLNFVKGVVDSDDLPLNVSREILQQNKILQIIQKKLIRKIISLIQEIMEDETKWQGFYENYHQFIKIGIVRDNSNKQRLSKLLRYETAKDPKKFVSLEQYVENMKEGQEAIYYLGGENKESLLNSPLLERLTKRGYDVLLLTAPIDEYVALHLGKFDKYKLVDVSREGLTLDQSDKDKQAEYKKDFEPLIDYLKEVLKKQVSAVEVSIRLASSPCALVSTAWGMSANLERIMKAQALADKSQMNGVGGKKVFEINPRHPIIRHLKTLVESDAQGEETEDIIRMLYDTAALTSGYALEDPQQLANRLNKLVSSALHIDPEEQVEEEVFAEEKEDDDKEDDDEEKEDL